MSHYVDSEPLVVLIHVMFTWLPWRISSNDTLFRNFALWGAPPPFEHLATGPQYGNQFFVFNNLAFLHGSLFTCCQNEIPVPIIYPIIEFNKSSCFPCRQAENGGIRCTNCESITFSTRWRGSSHLFFPFLIGKAKCGQAAVLLLFHRLVRKLLTKVWNLLGHNVSID